jgi:hypothetical protein
MSCNDCKGIKRDGTGTCILCGRRWLACKLYPWGEYLICSKCIEERKKKDLEAKENVI